MPRTSQQDNRSVAAASSCPALDCGSLVIEFRSADNLQSGHSGEWEFACTRCGAEFTTSRGELIFQSVPRRWLHGTWAPA